MQIIFLYLFQIVFCTYTDYLDYILISFAYCFFLFCVHLHHFNESFLGKWHVHVALHRDREPENKKPCFYLCYNILCLCCAVFPEGCFEMGKYASKHRMFSAVFWNFRGFMQDFFRMPENCGTVQAAACTLLPSSPEPKFR